mgnify:CR=1 FL=1
MYTKKFDILKEMISVAEKENLEYRVLYSNIERTATNDCTKYFGAILCTNLFKVFFEKTITPEDALKFEQYLRDKNSVRLNCRILSDEDKIKLV